ncbi:homoserine O-acetyltransferase [Heliorestis acidaminivorans]|uniref:Homoserine O-acetyltransferase n=1 Tax=Heliorestis acidaminivorans TaxID=553427 RepID=A0A6I0F3K1_9FIRM|nr:homoserine O-acetyltransferase [Heliorestis acidaminivorans]KAB2953307.1 homoserine O-acetyltransferase [Heliorestis acidaminivorans]
MNQGASRFSTARSARELITKTQHFTFANSPEEMVLESGHRLGPITVAYETYGALNKDRSNAILIAHALTGDQHGAGKYDESDKHPGWWDDMIGPGKPLDTNHFFIICSNVLGGCRGTTGPASINPLTGQPYGMSFPVFTVRDMVRVQKALLDYLAIERLLCVIGGSMGGMQVLEWAVTYPDQIDGVLPIATSGRMTAMGIAFNEVMRQTIMLDPAWNQGNYYPGAGPAQGLSIARMLGMITYRSDELFGLRFGRRMARSRPDDYYRYDNRFEIESYLHYQGEKLVKRFDANSYLYLCKAMDIYDIGRGRGGLAKALGRIKAKTLFVGIDSDWLYPPSYMVEMTKIMEKKQKAVEYKELKSHHGHDAFLIEFDQMSPIIKDFVQSLAEAKGL